MNAMSLRMLLSLIVGLAIGATAAAFKAPWIAAASAIAAPVGTLWLNALTMTVVPLVFGLIVVGVGAAAQQMGGRGVTARAFLWFAILLVGASAIGAVVSSGLLAFAPPPGALDAFGALGPPPTVAPAAEWLTGIIPANPIKAAAETAMVPLVAFALLFGFGVARIAPDLRVALLAVVRAIVETMLVIVGWVLLVAPIGVVALAFLVGARMGSGAAGTLAHYVFIVACAGVATTAAAYVLAIFAGRLSPLAFARAVLPSQTVALSTQSSLASLPAMIEASESLGVSKAAAGVVLPLAVSMFRASSVALNMAVAVYLAYLHGVPLGLPVIALGVLVAAAVSIAAVGLPAQVSFFTTIAPVCLAMGVPIAALPILLAVETIPDIFRTIGNVTADLAVARIVGRDEQATHGVAEPFPA